MSRKILAVILLLVIIIETRQIADYIKEAHLQKKTYNPLSEWVLEDEETIHPILEDTSKQVGLQQINEQIIGWLQIPGTQISYPLLQGTDNTYYLNHNFENQETAWGSIFMDYRNNREFKDQNTIIYGHNMKDHTMFNELNLLKQQEFIDMNHIIYINKYDDILVYEIFSVYIVEETFDYRKRNYENQLEYKYFLQEIKTRSYVQRPIEVTEEDSIITLSTCTTANKRLVVHGKLKK